MEQITPGSNVAILVVGLDGWFSNRQKLGEFLEKFPHLNLNMIWQHKTYYSDTSFASANNHQSYTHHTEAAIRKSLSGGEADTTIVELLEDIL